jgi:hypothetical protein
MRELTAGMITKEAMMEMEMRGYFVWRHNNLAIPGRKFNGLKGVPDIIGFEKKSGLSVYCEVKTKNDKISEYQANFMTRAKKAGCHVYLAVDDDGNVLIKEWE